MVGRIRIYLASTSPARLALLRSAGIEPVVLPSAVDEPATVARAEQERGAAVDAAGMVQLLARAKAEAILGRSHQGEALDGLILGGDSAFELDGMVYGKPLTAEVAAERWRLQHGRTGTLHSGHWLIRVRTGVETAAVGAVSSAEVTFVDDLTEPEIAAYIGTGEPLTVAGAFTIDSLGAPFIASVVGDPSTVVGLSLSTLRRLVRELGEEWTGLWNRR